MNKPKPMSLLGTADGAVLRCLDIIAEHPTVKLTQAKLVEIVGKLQTAHEAICRAAKEIDNQEDDL